MLQETYSQIEITDLNDTEISAGIILEMQDRQRYFEARMATVAEDEAATKVRIYNTLFPANFIVSCQSLDMKSMINEAKVNLQDWNPTLQQVRRSIYIQYNTLFNYCLSSKLNGSSARRRSLP